MHSYGGREATLESRAKEGLTATKAEGDNVLTQAKTGISSAEQKGKALVDEAKSKVTELKDKVVR